MRRGPPPPLGTKRGGHATDIIEYRVESIEYRVERLE
jgi:hypothetical protein